jgi:hypothetical protein
MTNPVEIFTIRLWREKLDERQSEWRGRVQHLGSGQARYFNEIGKIADFIADHLSKAKVEFQNDPDAATRTAGPRIRYPMKRRTRKGDAWHEKRPPVGTQPGWRITEPSFTKPYTREAGDRHLLRRFGGWIKARLRGNDYSRSIKKSLIILAAILLFVGDWLQVSWLGPRFHSLIAFRPETFFVGLMGIPHSLKTNRLKPAAGGKLKSLFQRRRQAKNDLF